MHPYLGKVGKTGVNTVVECTGQNFHLGFSLEQEIMIPPAQGALLMTHIVPQRKMKPAKANFHGIGLAGFIKVFHKEAPTSKPIYKPTPEQQESGALCIFLSVLLLQKQMGLFWSIYRVMSFGQLSH